MALPIPVDYPPMEAKLVAELPEGDRWQYEPKWDGFTGQAPGGPSRWSTERSGEWQPLETKLVVEVQ